MFFSDDSMFAVLRCKANYRLPNGGMGIKYKCVNGQWLIQDKVSALPDDSSCLPVCKKPCLNGGKCVAPSKCLCSEGFLGIQCERRKYKSNFLNSCG